MANLASMVLVGALWGCTNPFLRKGAIEAAAESSTGTDGDSDSPPPTAIDEEGKPSPSFLSSAVRSFLSWRVWIPYALNQSGSVVFYYLLASSDLSRSVPICNSLALVFSLATGFALGESMTMPLRTFVGAALILAGTTLCVSSSPSPSSSPPSAGEEL